MEVITSGWSVQLWCTEWVKKKLDNFSDLCYLKCQFPIFDFMISLGRVTLSAYFATIFVRYLYTHDKTIGIVSETAKPYLCQVASWRTKLNAKIERVAVCHVQAQTKTHSIQTHTCMQLRGHSTASFSSINLFPKSSCKRLVTTLRLCAGAPSCAHQRCLTRPFHLPSESRHLVKSGNNVQ